MLPVRVVQVPLDQIIRVVAVGYRFMPAVRSVNVIGGMRSALVVRRAMVLVGCGGCQGVLVHVIAVDVVQMPVVKVIHVPVVLDGGMSAVRAVNMRMFFLFHVGSSHWVPFGCQVDFRQTGSGFAFIIDPGLK
jgi:hypothetical protein